MKTFHLQIYDLIKIILPRLFKTKTGPNPCFRVVGQWRDDRVVQPCYILSSVRQKTREKSSEKQGCGIKAGRNGMSKTCRQTTLTFILSFRCSPQFVFCTLYFSNEPTSAQGRVVQSPIANPVS